MRFAKGLSPRGSYLKLKKFTPIEVIFLGCLGVLFLYLGGIR